MLVEVMHRFLEVWPNTWGKHDVSFRMTRNTPTRNSKLFVFLRSPFLRPLHQIQSDNSNTEKEDSPLQCLYRDPLHSLGFVLAELGLGTVLETTVNFLSIQGIVHRVLVEVGSEYAKSVEYCLTFGTSQTLCKSDIHEDISTIVANYVAPGIHGHKSPTNAESSILTIDSIFNLASANFELPIFFPDGTFSLHRVLLRQMLGQMNDRMRFGATIASYLWNLYDLLGPGADNAFWTCHDILLPSSFDFYEPSCKRQPLFYTFHEMKPSTYQAQIELLKKSDNVFLYSFGLVLVEILVWESRQKNVSIVAEY